MTSTDQMLRWEGPFGEQYTDRNTLTPEALEELYLRRYGVSRTALNERFLGGLDRRLRILEVGANVGNQLLCLQRQGFDRLWGIELQPYAVEMAKSRTSGINLVQGSAFDLPFRDGWFDLVFTSGVLIHINPVDLPRALDEIHRCTRSWIWGLEYYAADPTEIPYRGQRDLLWKDDFARRYRERFDDLELVREERLPYLRDDNVDAMFLLRKKGR